MKSFIYTIAKKKTKFGYDVQNRVFIIEDNKPRYIGLREYHSGSNRGDASEAVNLLVENGVLDENCLTKEVEGHWQGAGYINLEELNKSFTLIEIKSEFI